MRGRVGVSVGVVVGVPGEPGRHSAAAVELPAAAAARRAARRRARAVPLVYHEVDRHFALQTADVAVAEVIAEFVYLRETKWRYYHIWREQLHTIKLLEEKALHPQVPSYSKSTVPPKRERERERETREGRRSARKEGFVQHSSLPFSSSDASEEGTGSSTGLGK